MGNKSRQIKISIGACLIVALFLVTPRGIAALTLSSPNYQLENPSFTPGGGTRNSATYRVQDAAGSGGGTSSSANYKAQTGAIPPIFPGVPGVPTLTNTGGTLYSNLDFVVNPAANASDVTYAIAISSDNFATTGFVKADYTIGATEVWQSYTTWGGATGQRLALLAPSTTYKIKVKARLGPDNESGYSSIVSGTTSNPSLSMSIAGVTSGTVVGGATTNITTGQGSVSFGSLSVGSIRIGAQTITVSTNAVNGYTTSIIEDTDLVKTNGNTITALSSTNASPAAWPTGITTARFGYHTTDSSLCTGTANRFLSSDSFAKVETTPYEVACSSAAITSDVTNIVYKVEIEGLQAPGDYKNKVSYITTAQY